MTVCYRGKQLFKTLYQHFISPYSIVTRKKKKCHLQQQHRNMLPLMEDGVGSWSLELSSPLDFPMHSLKPSQCSSKRYKKSLAHHIAR